MRASIAALLLFVAVAAATSMSGLHVVGNNLVNGAGQGVLLHGVNHAGTEYMCSQGRGIVEGPTSTAAFWTALQSWNVNSIRLPLNSICWLNPPQQTIDPQYGGAQYQSAIKSLVDTATSYGLAVILELHWNAPQQGATWPWPSQQRPMPDADHAPAFWTSVATMFKSYSNVLFDLHNEPYPDGNQDSTAAWTCWRDGCFVSQEGYQAVGMTALLNAIRSTGACNVVMLGGVCYANALGSFLQYVPNDAACGNIAASWHVYDWTVCKDQNCWTNVVGPVAAQYPLIVGEIGEGDCSHNFIDPLMTWLDSIHASYLGWTWNTWNCGGQSGGPSLISNYDGTATAFGIGLKNHLSGLPDSYTLAQSASNTAAVNTIGVTAAGPSVAGPTSTVDTTSTTAAVSTSTTTASTASASTAFAASTTSASSLATSAALVTSSAASASTLSAATAAVTTATLSTASLSVSTGTVSASTSNEATTTNVAASTTSVAATTASATISSPLGGQATQAASATSAASSAATVAAASAATSASTSAAVTASTSATTSSVSTATATSATTAAVSSAAATTTGFQPTGYSLNIPLAHCPEDQRFTDQLLLGLAAFASDALGRSVSSSSFIATVDCDQRVVRVTYVGTDNAVGPLLTQAVESNSLLGSSAFTAACGGNCQDALESNKKNSLPAWAIALIVVGAVFGLVLIGGLVFLCMAAHKRRRGLTEVYSQLLN